MIKKAILSLCGAFILSASFGQLSEKKEYPVIGQPCPDFTLNEVHYNNKSKISLKDLKGKHVILDFWAKDCLSCIASFTKWDEIQKSYKNNLQVILVGLYDTKYHSGIKGIYEKYKKKFNLNLTVAYDSALFEPPFKSVAGVPWAIWIDDKGVVKAVTGGSDINKENIESFLAGTDFPFFNSSYDAYEQDRSNYDDTKPLMFQGNGGKYDTDFLFRSLLAVWRPGMSTRRGLDIDAFFQSGLDIGIPKYEVVSSPLSDLFVTAYTGKGRLPDSFYHKLLFAPGVDSSLFKDDWRKGIGVYSYSLIIPKERANVHYLMKIMQNDLENYFGYRARVIEKEMPCLILKAIDMSKLDKIKCKEPKSRVYENGADYFIALNVPLTDVANSLKGATNKARLKLFNETGYWGNVDIKLDVLIADFNEIRKMLQLHGLDIIEGNRKMKVLEITNCNN